MWYHSSSSGHGLNAIFGIAGLPLPGMSGMDPLSLAFPFPLRPSVIHHVFIFQLPDEFGLRALPLRDFFTTGAGSGQSESISVAGMGEAENLMGNVIHCVQWYRPLSFYEFPSGMPRSVLTEPAIEALALECVSFLGSPVS